MVVQITKTYECPICYAVNSSVKTHCSTCGTIPGHYSVIAKPCRVIDDTLNTIIEVVNAVGCDRAERHRTCKRALRTVSPDYYASVD